MFYLALALIILGVVAFVAGKYLSRRINNADTADVVTAAAQRDDGCCGQHEVCEKDSLLAAVSKEIEYYEDEELDRFRGRASSDYSAEEVEEFQDILFSMKTEEVAGWVRSLQLREVALPDALKDDVFMIVGERRFD